MERRYGDDASIVYHDIKADGVADEFREVLAEIDRRGLLYPVTVIDGVPAYDGAVSYPAIMRAITNKLLEVQGATSE
jgi:disulfide oxidoreductase YuzD